MVDFRLKTLKYLDFTQKTIDLPRKKVMFTHSNVITTPKVFHTCTCKHVIQDKESRTMVIKLRWSRLKI